ncbi:hypothetical protein L596_014493 [Steinernema carpocapsae]|uniref:DH domain-containing protein n=1 Tax=Steinernema carpocapsae TaxID=34508 RepID=A0A4U5NC52_STECR|nr:hypothetical protein L596_014493 [Steinernema carpocapsae]
MSQDLPTLAKRDAVKKNTETVCVVGAELMNDEHLCELLTMHFKLKVVYSERGGLEYNDPDMVFLVSSFDSPEFYDLRDANKRILGPPVVSALAQLGKDVLPFPKENRPLYCYAMKDIRMSISGTHNDESRRLVDLVHFMGEAPAAISPLTSISSPDSRKDLSTGFEAVKLNRPVMNVEWVYLSWKNGKDINFHCTEKQFMEEHRLRPFETLRLYFVGFTSADKKEMAELTVTNRGYVTHHSRDATHVVVEPFTDKERLKNRLEESSKAVHVTKQWFWMSLDRGVCMDEECFPVFDGSHNRVLQPRENRKRTAESPAADDVPAHARRNISRTSLENGESSATTGLPEHLFSTDELEKLSISPRRVDKRQQVCLEMLETEENYLKALMMMVDLFKTPLENRNADPASEVLTKSEMAQIFGKIPPLIQVHSNIARNLKTLIRNHWRPDNLIGKVWADHHNDLKKVYPPFINSYDTAKQMLEECDLLKPTFHNFLKAAESHPDCCRNTLKELLIRPVQRLPSVILLLKELLKRTEKSNPDYAYITHAIEYVEQVVSLSNESRRQTDNYARVLELLNEIDGLPVSRFRFELTSGHITSGDVRAGHGRQLGRPEGRTICFICFNDFVVLAKVRNGVKDLNMTQKSKNITLSRNISFVGSIKGFRSEKKKYKYSRLCYFSTFRKIERVTAGGANGMIYVITLRDNIGGDEPLIVQPGGEYTADSLDYFMNTLCKYAGMMANRELTIESIDDEYLTLLQSNCLETYQLLVKALSNMAETNKDGSLRRSSTFRRAVSSVSISLSRISKFSSRCNLDNISEVSRI